MSFPLLNLDTYTTEDIFALPEGKRAELIDGQIFLMAPPTRMHQEIISALHYKIRSYFESNHGPCRVYPAPFAVFLNQDNRNYVEPDISVICDIGKLDDKGCNGAPDWLVEVASPGTKHMDYGIKLYKYRTAGVREYWIINPITKTVNVYDWEHDDEKTNQYSFDEEINSCIFNDFSIHLSGLLP